MQTYVKAAVAAMALLALPFAGASAQSNDGKNRWVRINNTTSSQTIVQLYAAPSYLNMSVVTGRDLIPRTTIRPGQAVSINFDDGNGTCYFDIRGTSTTTGRDWVVRNLNVCAMSHLNFSI